MSWVRPSVMVEKSIEVYLKKVGVKTEEVLQMKAMKDIRLKAISFAIRQLFERFESRPGIKVKVVNSSINIYYGSVLFYVIEDVVEWESLKDLSYWIVLNFGSIINALDMLACETGAEEIYVDQLDLALA
ncbi:MAG: hypothetical protein H0Z24_03070 [Thermosipho sp. (in: Bacteria)]|nr:hypothetical protein [Thermosipho sp. (in: thermotogales)]